VSKTNIKVCKTRESHAAVFIAFSSIYKVLIMGRNPKFLMKAFEGHHEL